MSLIGLIDEDWISRKKMTFPNLSLMKLSAWHKARGDRVEWYEDLLGGYDRVYMSRVFSEEYTTPYTDEVDAREIVRGGSGYAISVQDGKEVYNPDLDPPLPYEIDHAFPDYGLYGIEDEAYGFLTKGCPRHCHFCHVGNMQGLRVRTVATLDEFWNGQKFIKLLDPNLTASPDYFRHMEDLANSKAKVDFTQGLDARMLTEAKIEALNRVKYERIHFAWDNPTDDLEGRFRLISQRLKRFSRVRVSCYVLTNFNSTWEQDLYRVMTLRSLNIQPYVMIYRKSTAPKRLRQLQRWCSPFIFWKVDNFEDYHSTIRNKR